MKKFFTLFAATMLSLMARAEVVFVDGSGKAYADGDIMTLTAEVDPEWGDVFMPAPQLKNTGSEAVSVFLDYSVDVLPEGTVIADCFSGACQNRQLGNFMTIAKTIDAGATISTEIEWNNFKSMTYVEDVAICKFTICEGAKRGATVTVRYVHGQDSGTGLPTGGGTGNQGEEGERRQMLLGLYTSDLFANPEDGTAHYDETESLTSTVITATYFPKKMYAKMTDGRLDAIRFALACNATVNRVVVFAVADGGVNLIGEQAVADKKGLEGWNLIKLDTPCNLPSSAEGLLVGFEYVEDGKNVPLSVNPYVNGEMSWMSYFKDKSGVAGWRDYSVYGALSVQAWVSSANIPVHDVVLSDLSLSTPMLAIGQEFSFSFSASNFGTTDVTDYKIQVKLDGQSITELTGNQGGALSAAIKTFEGKYILPANLKRGDHSLAVSVVQVAGETPTVGTEDDELNITFFAYNSEDEVGRQQYILEEFTSHSCTNCPMGAAVIEAMQKQNDQIAVVCIHTNFKSADPFNTPQCDSLQNLAGINSYPTVLMNRNYNLAESALYYTIGYQDANQGAAYCLEQLEARSVPAFATIDIATDLNDLDLTIQVSGEGGSVAKNLLQDYVLTVYVVEDGLKYRQLNNGIWTSNYTHNHVLRKVVSSLTGDAIKWTSNSTYSNTLHTTLDESWVQDNLSVVAFLSKYQSYSDPDRTSMCVTNANSLKLTENEGDEGQGEDLVTGRFDADLHLSMISDVCQLMSEGLSPNGQYAVGTNYATYAPALWTTANRNVVDYPKYPEGSFHAVNNSGTAVGEDGIEGEDDPGKYALAIKLDGTIVPLYSNAAGGEEGSAAWAISEDGKVIAGYYFDTAWNTYPCYWNEKGERFDLPLPTPDQAGVYVNGGEVRWMSSDASVMAGFLIDDMGTWPAAIWRRGADGTYTCIPVCRDFFELNYGQGKPYMQFTPKSLSANGEWLSLTVQEEYEFGKVVAPAIKAARLNLNTMQLEVLTMPEPISSQAMEPGSVANDGTMVLFTDIDGLVGRVGYLWPANTNQVVDLDLVLSHVVGFPGVSGNVPCGITPDARYVLGFGFTEEADIFSYLFDYKKYCDAVSAIESVVADHSVQMGIYNLQGIRVSNKSVPGLYVEAGRKLMVK